MYVKTAEKLSKIDKMSRKTILGHPKVNVATNLKLSHTFTYLTKVLMIVDNF